MKVAPLFFTIILSFAFLQAQESIYYFPYTSITPGQVRYSSKNVWQKMEKALKEGNVCFDSCHGRYVGKYDDGRSFLSPEQALPVIRAPFGYVLADGHHDTMATICFGLTTVPVKIVENLKDLDEAQFWIEAQKKGWVFLKDLNGNETPPLTCFKQMQDDPNRYFAAITARKFSGRNLAESTGAEYPIWVKEGKDIPFIEFYISDALRKAGINYTYEMGDNPPEEFIEEARRALVEANISGLKVVKKRIHYASPEFLQSKSIAK